MKVELWLALPASAGAFSTVSVPLVQRMLNLI